MNILAVNSGSSSLKFAVFDSEYNILIKGNFLNHSKDNYKLSYVFDKVTTEQEISEENYKNRLDFLFDIFSKNSIVIDKVVHRVVHGSTIFLEPTVIDKSNIELLTTLNELAPLHNPVQVEFINQTITKFPNLVNYAVFDTEFHKDIPEVNYIYGLPYHFIEELGIRKYGFHGISHEYVSKFVEKLNKSSNYKLISCHLGSGSSICAVIDGKSFDTTMGFSPSEGLIMSTRAGDVSFELVDYLERKININDKTARDIINYESGLIGISGYTKDMRILLEDYNNNPNAKLAVDVFVAKIVKFIGQYHATMGGLDYLSFTGGIGEAAFKIREMVCEKIKHLGIILDIDKNNINSEILSTNDSKVKVIIVKANEELAMAQKI